MLRTLGCSLLALSLCVWGLDAGGGKDAVKKDTPVKDKVKKDVVKDKTPKDKDKTPKDKKFEVPKDAIAGKVKSVDLKEGSFVLAMTGGKDRMFLVDAKTEFYGPRGGDRGTGPSGLKDDCMEKGYEIRVVASKDGKTAVDVHLPVRKGEKKDSIDKDKKATDKS